MSGRKNPFNPINAVINSIKSEIKGNSLPSCAALKDKRCSIYSVRPAICRLYGVAEGLECPFACKPKKKLSKQEAHAIIREIEAI